MNLREYFDRYGWLLAFLALVLVCVVAIYGRDLFCASAEPQCTREWLSALGGWFAGVVAFLTITSMRIQISDASRHQQENVEISLMPVFALSFRVRDLVQKQVGLLHDLKSLERRGDRVGRRPMERTDLWNAARAVSAFLNNQDLVEFNTTVATEPFQTRHWLDRYVMEVIGLVERYNNDVTNGQGDDELHRLRYRVFIHGAVSDLARDLESYLRDRDEKARGFLERWRQPAGEPLVLS